MAYSLRRGKAAVLRAAALVLLAVLVVVASIGAWVIRSPLPKVNGSVTVSGINASVTIRRDNRGIAHIEATNESDLFFGEGFACAQDRLWQIDLLRRTAEGKLSEIVGPGALSIDRYMLTIGLGLAARHDALNVHGQTLQDLQAYAAGVNAAASTHPLPLEFKLLGYRPEPWTPVDSIAIVKLMAQRLDDQWHLVELKALIEKKVGSRAANALLDAQIPSLEHFIPGNRSITQRVANVKQVTSGDVLVADSPIPPDPQSGSNNWVVAGNRVSTGKPVLSNDTHLEHAVPSTYWLVHLSGAGYNVEGFIIPGIPFVALGHNGRIAFGVTSGDIAVQDLFVEKFRSPTSDEYLANGRWLHANHRIEQIAVKGSKPVTLDITITRHGPVIKRDGTTAYALDWTILHEGRESDLLRQLDLAGNWDQFEGAMAQVVGPVFNWVYADVDGNIGYQLAGKVPNRLHGDGSVPVEGQDDRYAWHGYMPFNELPRAFSHVNFLATANNQLAPSNTAIGSSPFYDKPYRVNRIYQLLASSGDMSPQQIGALQADVYDYARVKFAAVTASLLLESSDSRLNKIGAQLAAWDGMMTENATVPTFLNTELRILEDRLLAPKIGPALRFRYDRDYNVIVPFERVIDGDRTLESIGISRAALLSAIPGACATAADLVKATNAQGISRIEPWGKENLAVFDHPAGRQWPLNVLLNVKAFQQPGDGFAIYAAKPDHGPASRLVSDLSNWDNSSMVLTLGESGQFNSPHYQDEVGEFQSVTWVPMPFSDAAVRAATKDTLTLNP